MWFKNLIGFDEESPENVRKNLLIEGTELISKVNGARFDFGHLEIPTLAELKKKAPRIDQYQDQIQVSEIVANVQQLHANPENSNALFQAASQFNLLEMTAPHVVPEKGVDIYERDFTQGPACAISCGAGTIYRNYFVPTNGKMGQTSSNQIDCLDELGKELRNDELELWKMSNGYTMCNQAGLLHLNALLSKLSPDSMETLKGLLKVGIQWDTQVTIEQCSHHVSQVYCSALPVAYSHVPSIYWKRFASLILEATYEATFYAALINSTRTQCNKVFLTFVGGGAFGNDNEWIIAAIKSALQKFKNVPLDIRFVSYGSTNRHLREVIRIYSY